MGVNGLWKLLDPSGKPVPLETLENKVLAVDVSIWLHQVVKGFQDSHGNPLPNAHLLGLFHRICKLLFYRIKPVFVFDGGVPHLKKQTVAIRNQLKSKAEIEADRVREQLLKNLVKHTALKRVLGSKASNIDLSITQRKENDMFELPPENKKMEETLSGCEEDALSSEEELYSHKNWMMTDLHAVDVYSSHFKSLPADVRHDILSELKETRKQSSWGRLHEMPKESGDFSSYQMTRLLKRRSIQVSLEDAEREMGGRSLSLGELEELLSEQGVVTDSNIGMRIASDNITRYVYVKEIGKQILAKSSSKGTNINASLSSQTQEGCKVNDNESESDSDLRAVQESILHKELEVQKSEGDWSSNSEEDFASSQETSVNSDKVSLKLAQNFMFENSGLTQQQILAVIQYQKAVEREVQQNSEHFLSPDQPSTSGMGSKAIALKGHGDALTCSMVQDKIGEATCISTCVSNIAEASGSRTDVSNTTEASCSKIGVSSTSDMNSILHKQKGNVLNDEIIDNNSFAAKQGVGLTEKDNISLPVLSPVANGLKNSDDEGEKMNSDSDSDSDTGFVEVTDVATLPVHSTASEKNTLEVLIKHDKIPEIEDDIFADIFCAETSERLSAVNNKLTKDTGISLSCSDDIVHTGSGGKENYRFDEEDISNGINGLKEATESELKKEGKELMGNVVNQDDCKQKNLEVKRDVGIISGIETEEQAKKPQVTTTTLSSEELQKLQTSIEEKHLDLLAERGKQERLAANITDQMHMEAQELLQLFGIPYIVAPMEAEAQCAFLDLLSLTDGTITDDSDVWLFGGQKVYKNFFNQKKHVLCFKASDIKQCFKLERQQLVLLALLVGSDYTPGIQGVGPVTALEILAAFPTDGRDNSNILSGLQKFREWWHDGMTVGPGKTSLKNKLKDVQFVEGFPSVAVVDAYLHPKVDESKETFSWGSPDLTSLRDFTRQKFGWTKTKTDEILLPVMKKLEERKSQMSLDSYFKVIPKLQATEGKLSKRVQQAVHRLGRAGSFVSEEPISEGSKSGRISLCRKKKTDTNVKTRPDNGKARSRGRGRSHESGTVHEQSQPSDIPDISGEFIPQRERGKINALKRKLKAIEVFRTSKTGLDHTKREKKVKRQELIEAELSESSSDCD